ncbi:MAG: PAS domain S-box protein, partial [Chloroflexota bacterium]
FEELQESSSTYFDFIDASHWLCEPGRLESELLVESPRRVEYDFHRRDGSIFVADASMSLLRDAANQPNAILSITRDITERKSSEAQLRKLSQAVMQSGDNIVITDLRGSIEYVNPQFEETTGYSLAEAIGNNPSILKSGEQSEELYTELWKTITSGHIWRGELHNKRRDGSLYWEYVSIAPVANEAGEITNFVAIKKDITGSKQLEQALRIKDSAIESSINAIALADLAGRVTYVNPSFVTLWGYFHFEEIIGKDLKDFWVDSESIAKLTETLTNGEGWQGEMNARTKNGSIMIVDVSVHMVKGESGQPLCIMSSFVDITARKKAEEAEREEHRLVDALRKTAEALSSTLNLDDVLERILENAGDVIDNDAMTIMLLEDDNLRVVRHRGYAERGITDYIEKTIFKIDDFATLRAMIDTRQPSIVSDVKSTPFWAPRPATDWIRSYAGVPICKRDKVIGFLNLESATPNHFTADQANRMQAFASQAAVAIENASLYEQDHILSITDGLTGLYNNRYFYELTHLEFERTRRYPVQLSMLMIDIDHFKQVNDTFGHMFGDDVLRETAHRVRACLRSADLAA